MIYAPLDAKGRARYLYVYVNVIHPLPDQDAVMTYPAPWKTPPAPILSTEPARTFTIRQLSKEFDITARALRFYEDKGLIDPERRGQTRLYSARDRARLKLILRGKRMGFSLTEIQHMLDLYSHQDGNAHQMRVALNKWRAQIDTLKRQRQDIDDAIAEMIEGCAFLEAQLKALNPD